MNVFSCPNCRCGQTCVICSDTNNSGTCALARITGTATGSTSFYTISTSNGIALSTVLSTTVPEIWCETDFKFSTGGDQARLFIKSSSTGNNCWYCETMASTGGGGHFRLVERVSGTDTQKAIKSPIVANTDTLLTMHLCYGEGRVVGTLTGTTAAHQVSSTAATTTSARPYAGVGTGSISSPVLFSNFEHQYGYNATDKPTCQSCVPVVTSCSDVCTSAPRLGASFDVAVDFSGATYSRGECDVTWPTTGLGTECAECDSFAAEYVLTASTLGTLCSNLSNGCPTWKIEFNSTGNYWCGAGVDETDPSNIACNGGNGLMTLCIHATFSYIAATAKWQWLVALIFQDDGAIGASASYRQASTDPTLIGDCESGPWTLTLSASTTFANGPPCNGSLPASITLRVV